MYIRRLFITLLVAVGVVLTSMASSPWEEVRTVVPGMERVDSEAAVDIAVRDNYVYVSCSRPVTVKVFTILGQLISQETLQPGIRRLRISAKGIYILKIGGITRRITI